jgi:hypothetical protein
VSYFDTNFIKFFLDFLIPYTAFSSKSTLRINSRHCHSSNPKIASRRAQFQCHHHHVSSRRAIGKSNSRLFRQKVLVSSIIQEFKFKKLN